MGIHQHYSESHINGFVQEEIWAGKRRFSAAIRQGFPVIFPANQPSETIVSETLYKQPLQIPSIFPFNLPIHYNGDVSKPSEMFINSKLLDLDISPLPSGKHTKNYGKSQSLMAKSTISMAIFKFANCQITRGYCSSNSLLGSFHQI